MLDFKNFGRRSGTCRSDSHGKMKICKIDLGDGVYRFQPFVGPLLRGKSQDVAVGQKKNKKKRNYLAQAISHSSLALWNTCYAIPQSCPVLRGRFYILNFAVLCFAV
jgi:hypothetical protein